MGIVRNAIVSAGAKAVLEEMRDKPWPPQFKPTRNANGTWTVQLVSAYYDILVDNLRDCGYKNISEAIIKTYLEGPDTEEAST